MYIYKCKSFWKALKMLNICYCTQNMICQGSLYPQIIIFIVFCITYRKASACRFELKWRSSFKKSVLNVKWITFLCFCVQNIFPHITFILLTTVNVTILKGLVYTSFFFCDCLFNIGNQEDFEEFMRKTFWHQI